jgi:vancomycin aglycone glucosyltransferase
MRVLLSTGIGSRGDVQPLVALASRLRESGHQARLCVPPDFRDWVEGLGFPVTPIGPRLRGPRGPARPPGGAAGPAPQGPAPQGHATGTSPERLGQLTEAIVAGQFTTIAEAARGCDVIVETALQVAARSVAEVHGLRYVFAAFCPAFLPSPHHPPPPLPAPGREQPPSAAGHRELWSRHAERFNDRFGPALNQHRAAAGLAPVDDVRGHIFTSRPWLAADPVLAPWPGLADGGDVFQAGAWILPDDRPLGPGLEAFLQAGEPPVYFGFGSMRMPPGLAQEIVAAARKSGRRAIISAGSAGLALAGGEPDSLLIGEVNQQKLFRHVAAVVHHGGAGTTTAAALAGAPQVVIPQAYDQHYWAQRVRDLGIGIAHAPGTPDAGSLTAALDDAVAPSVANRARSLSAAIRTNGAQAAVANLIDGPAGPA